MRWALRVCRKYKRNTEHMEIAPRYHQSQTHDLPATTANPWIAREQLSRVPVVPRSPEDTEVVKPGHVQKINNTDNNDRQTGRRADGQLNGQTEQRKTSFLSRQTDRERPTERQTNGQTQRRQTDRQIDRQNNRQTDRQTDRQTE